MTTPKKQPERSKKRLVVEVERDLAVRMDGLRGQHRSTYSLMVNRRLKPWLQRKEAR